MSSEIKAQIASSIKVAMRAKDKNRLGVLRNLMSEFKKVEVDERIELDDARVLAILDKQVKQRKDSCAQYTEANRQDLADTESTEMLIIQEFLPAALSQAEITQLIQDAIASTGAESMRDMGKVMGIVKPQVQGKADMGEVSQHVKALLP